MGYTSPSVAREPFGPCANGQTPEPRSPMTPLKEFYIFTALIWGSLAVGLVWRRGNPAVAQWTAPLLKFNAITFPVLGFFIAFWRLDLAAHGWRLVLVPVIAAAGSIVTFLAARIFARRRALPPRRYGAFLLSAAISNIGLTFGMPLCYALFGLDGFALAGLYVLYFPFFVYIVLFTFADRWRRLADGHDTPRNRPGDLVTGFFRDPFRTIPILSFAAGLVMNFLFGNNAIPAWLKALNHMGIYLSLLFAFLAVGFTIHAGGLRTHAREIMALCGLKFLLTPAAAVGVALLFGFSGRALAVIAIESACPVAIFSVMTAAIYDLDQELAGAALIVTSALATGAAFAGLTIWGG